MCSAESTRRLEQWETEHPNPNAVSSFFNYNIYKQADKLVMKFFAYQSNTGPLFDYCIMFYDREQGLHSVNRTIIIL